MCFYVSRKEEFSQVKVAEENIVCYKYLEEGLKAPFYGDFIYEVGKVQPKVGLEVGSGIICEGYHSCTENAFKEGNLYYRLYYKCIIPAGSRYYENPDDGEYVSDSIVLTTDQPLSWEEGVALTGLHERVNQKEFSTFFMELIKKGVKREDISDTRYILFDENGEWLFGVEQKPRKTNFYYPYDRIYSLFRDKFGVNQYHCSWLMQPILESHFNMGGVTAQEGVLKVND